MVELWWPNTNVSQVIVNNQKYEFLIAMLYIL